MSSLDKLCYEFFREFARYEYCLKAIGLYHNTKNAKANWDKYAKQVEKVFDNPDNPDLIDAINYYMDSPPKKQIIKDGVLSWDDSLPQEDSTAIKTFILIRRVRNNLFHGGKFNGEWFQPERSEILIMHALTILRACAQSHSNVSKAYAGIAF